MLWFPIVWICYYVGPNFIFKSWIKYKILFTHWWENRLQLLFPSRTFDLNLENYIVESSSCMDTLGVKIYSLNKEEIIKKNLIFDFSVSIKKIYKIFFELHHNSNIPLRLNRLFFYTLLHKIWESFLILVHIRDFIL